MVCSKPQWLLRMCLSPNVYRPCIQRRSCVGATTPKNLLFCLPNAKGALSSTSTMAENAMPTFPPGYAEESLGPRVVAVAIAFIVLEIVVVTLRFATRIVYKTQWGLDDYLIPPALLFALGMCIIPIGAYEQYSPVCPFRIVSSFM